MRWLVLTGIALLSIAVLYVFLTQGVTVPNVSPEAGEASRQTADPSAKPPVARRIENTRTVHGFELVDHYAWLRDPEYPKVDDEAVLDYLGQENGYFERHFKPLKNAVESLYQELKARQPDADESVPYTWRGHRYQWRFESGAQYRTWYRASTAQPDDFSVILDERQLAEGLDYFRLGGMSVSPDGNKLAYSMDDDGSERFTLHVIDLASREALTAPIENTLDEAVWAADSASFLYTVVSEEWRPYRVLQRILAPPEANTTDRLVYEEDDTGFFVDVSESQSEQYAFITTGDHTTNETRMLPLDDLEAEPQVMVPRQRDHEYFVDHRQTEGGDEFVIRSNKRQSNYDIYVTQNATAAADEWQRIVDGNPQRYITGHLPLRDHLVLTESIDGLDQVNVIDTAGKNHYVKFEEAAYTADLGTNPNAHATALRLNYSSLTTPNSIYDYDLAGRELNELKVQVIPSGYDPSRYTSERLLVDARDGTLVPVSIVRATTTLIDGTAPLYLYAYGAYGYGTPPSFSASRISLLDRGFVFAIAHIRGGDELGYDWYTQGKLNHRTNTFNDFVDVARHLIARKYTDKGRIAIAGGSAGGELMGAVVNQAPDLWGVVAAHVPFVDVLNTMLDDTLPLTPMEWPEWGNPIEDADAFEYIKSYSPYDQLEPGEYPPMLVTAGLNDPRVTYWEPAKYVAKLRHLKTDDNVLLLKTNMEAGHGGKSGRFEALRELAEQYAFFFEQLNVEED